MFTAKKQVILGGKKQTNSIVLNLSSVATDRNYYGRRDNFFNKSSVTKMVISLRSNEI